MYRPSQKKNRNIACSASQIIFISCTLLHIRNWEAGKKKINNKKNVYSEFPSPFKLIMGSGTKAFTMWNINYYFSIRLQVLGVNSLYCVKCQSNYHWSALFLNILSLFERHPVYWCTATSSQRFHSGKLLNRKVLDNAGFSKWRSGKKLKVAK